MMFVCTIMLWTFSIRVAATMASNINFAANGATIGEIEIVPTLYESNGAVQLNISWTVLRWTANEINYHVTVQGITEHCSIKPCIAETKGNATSIVVPANPVILTEHSGDCVVERGCGYRVLLALADRSEQRTETFVVPDCIDDVCSCRHNIAPPILNITFVAATQTVLLFWSQNRTDHLPHDTQLGNISLSLGRQNVGMSTLSWGGPYHNLLTVNERIAATNHTDTVHGSHAYRFDTAVAGVRLIARAHFVDRQGCGGKESTQSIEIPKPIISHFEVDTSRYHSATIFFSIILLSIIFVIGLRMFRTKKTKSQYWQGVYYNVSMGNGIPNVTMHDNYLYVDKDILEARSRGEVDLFEVSPTALRIGREIGEGAFGRVFIARLDDCGINAVRKIVAAKQLKKKPTVEELEEFRTEITTMKRVGHHPNVVSLLGCCTRSQPFIMIMEYVGCGDLLQYLRQVRRKHVATVTSRSGSSSDMSVFDRDGSRGRGRPSCGGHRQTDSSSNQSYITQPHDRPSLTETMYTTIASEDTNMDIDMDACGHATNFLEHVVDHNELQNFAVQIARGMRHLESKQITHRDLAARNILIDETKTLKISDFGLSRTGIYVNTKNKRVPLRWLSPEAIRDHLYSSKSDVWSFGIVLWEIGTLGGFPYPAMENQEVLKFLAAGHRLDRPENCSQDLYRLMLDCWAEAADERPTFDELVHQIEQFQKNIYIDFDQLRDDYVFPPIK